MCCNLNISSLEIELDAKAIVDILNKPAFENSIISPILDDCRLLIGRFFSDSCEALFLSGE